MEKRTVFFTMVMHPAKGWTRVGNAYPSRKAAADWLPFVRGAWRGLRAKVSQCAVRLTCVMRPNSLFTLSAPLFR